MKCECGGNLVGKSTSMFHSYFQCDECGRQEGAYNAMIKKLLVGQPLPPGAPLLFDRDIDKSDNRPEGEEDE